MLSLDVRSGAIRNKDVLAVFAVCLLLSLFCLPLLVPATGWDDANITLNYAENVANGHGYVYYVNGERVEGSTSALWTAIATLGFMVSGEPENLLILVSFLFAFGTVLFTRMTAKSLLRIAGLDPGMATLPTLALFAMLPSFFGVTVFSLMETATFCIACAGFVWSAVALIEDRFVSGGTGPRKALLLAIFSVIMTLTRPEGIALVVGGCLVLALLGMIWRKGALARTAFGAVVSAGAALAVLTAGRLAYFGAPFPNTYYAKVATDTMAELRMGLNYAESFLRQPEHVALILLAGSALVRAYRHRRQRPGLLPAIIFLASVFVGVTLVYIALGGDIFPEHRYFLVTLPALIPAASLVLCSLIRAYGTTATAVVASALLAGIGSQWFSFWVGNRNYDYMQLAFHHNLADNAREIGRRFNELPEKPSIAVYIAGGIAMTYDGVIYDMNGLNWVEMARTNRAERDGYGGFTKSVLLSAEPDIVGPHLNGCIDARWADNAFVDDMLHGLFKDPEFLALYELDCWEDMSFFRRKGLPSLQ